MDVGFSLDLGLAGLGENASSDYTSYVQYNWVLKEPLQWRTNDSIALSQKK